MRSAKPSGCMRSDEPCVVSHHMQETLLLDMIAKLLVKMASGAAQHGDSCMSLTCSRKAITTTVSSCRFSATLEGPVDCH